MSAFTREQIKKGSGIVEAEVPAFGGTVRLGSLSTIGFIEWLDSAAAKDAPGGKMAKSLKLVALCFLDGETGERLTHEQHDEFIKDLCSANSRDVQTVVAKALEINGYDEASKRAREIAKNDSGEAATNDSRTDSPTPTVV